MDNKFKFCLLLVLIGFLNILKSQVLNDPSLTVTDHNGNVSPINISCDYKFDNTHCIKLNVQYPEIRFSTNYESSSIPYNPIGKYSDGKEVKISEDDQWSDIIPLPFQFCYYGRTYSSIIIGDNGVISFDIQSANTECPYTIAGSIPSKALMPNTIFGAYHDMTNDQNVFGCEDGECGNILINVVGTAPHRRFIINYNNMNHFGCDDVSSTFQIVLHETTNIIDIYIKDKNLTCAIGNEKRALIGITNRDNSQSLSIEGRNTGIWEAHEEAWRFTPKGEVVNPIIKWFDPNKKQIGTGESVVICPHETNQYMVEVTYNICKPMILQENILINYSPEYPQTKNIVENYCVEGSYLNQIVNFESLIPKSITENNLNSVSLHNSIEDATSGENPLTGLDSYTMTSNSKTFYLRAEKTKNCFSNASLTINLNTKPNISIKEPIIVCKTSLSPSELVLLQNYNSFINGVEEGMRLDYYSTLENATSNTNPITQISMSSNTSLYVKVSNINDSNCYSIIRADFILQPQIIASPWSVYLCNVNFNGRLDYNLHNYETTIKDQTGLTFEYYRSLENANAGINPIENTNAYTVIHGTVIFVKIKKGPCYKVETISFSFLDAPAYNLYDLYVCYNENGSYTNLYNYYRQMTGGSSRFTLEGFYTTFLGGTIKDPNTRIQNPENYKVEEMSTYVFVRFYDNTFKCDFVRLMAISLVKPLEQPPFYNTCDVNNDGEELLNLDIVSRDLLKTEPSSVSYYLTLEDQKADKNPIKEIMVKPGTKVYVKIRKENLCINIDYINLGLTAFSLNTPFNVYVCDSENNGSENYNLNTILQNLVLPSNSIFYRTEQDAIYQRNPITSNNYTLTSNNTIYVRNNNSKNCPQIIPINFFLSKLPSLDSLFELEVCDTDNNNFEFVDLNQIINKYNIDNNKISIKYYLSQQGAEELNNNQKIDNINSFRVNNRQTTIYARLTDKITSCFSIIPTNIKMIIFPTLANISLIVCDPENDGEEIINLETLNNQIDPTNSLNLNYYKNLDDANNSNNEIKSYKLSNSTKLFVKISSNINCFVIKELNFEFSPIPSVENNTVLICDNNADGKEKINLEIYRQSITKVSLVNYNFEYYRTKQDAEKGTNKIISSKDFDILKFPTTIFYKVINRNGCSAIASLTFNSILPVLAQNKEIELCDNNSDMQEYMDLTNYTPDMLISSGDNLKISFYTQERAAINKDETMKIDNPENYSITLSQTIIWVRFETTNTDCFTIRNIKINLIPLPKLINGRYPVCDNNIDGIYTLDLDELRYVVILNPESFTFTYYHNAQDALDDKNKIIDYKNFNVDEFNKDIYVRGTNSSGCSSVKKVTLYTKAKIETNERVMSISSCSNDFRGFGTFDLNSLRNYITSIPNSNITFYKTLTDAQNQTNSIMYPDKHNNINPNEDKVYARVSSSEYCPNVKEINLTVLPLPISPLQKEFKICPNGETLELIANTGNKDDTYVWENGNTSPTLTVNKAGIYKVTITGINGCQVTYSANVTEYEKVEITDLQEGNDYITVIAKGPGPLEYSMDGKNWKTSSTFNGLKPGIYTFYARTTINNCIPISKKGVIFLANNFITPNTDQQNDLWRLCGLEHFDNQESHIQIFDKYGKVVFDKISRTCFEWDGKYLGRPLPSTSYWYVINIADGRRYTGWIMLRNHDGYFK